MVIYHLSIPRNFCVECFSYNSNPGLKTPAWCRARSKTGTCNIFPYLAFEKIIIIGGSFRVTLVVDWWFLPQHFGDVVGTYEGHLLLSQGRWGGDSGWRWWGHLNTILHNQTCFELFALRGDGEQKNKLFALARAEAIRNFRGDTNCTSEPPSWNLHNIFFYKKILPAICYSSFFCFESVKFL